MQPYEAKACLDLVLNTYCRSRRSTLKGNSTQEVACRCIEAVYASYLSANAGYVDIRLAVSSYCRRCNISRDVLPR